MWMLGRSEDKNVGFTRADIVAVYIRRIIKHSLVLKSDHRIVVFD
jgi:hypothetical protein